LPSIEEDKREYTNIESDQFQSSQFSGKSDVHRIYTLPYLHRKELEWSKLPQPNSNDPIINLIFKNANKHKVDPYLFFSDSKIKYNN
jgi:hypothetical protein